MQIFIRGTELHVFEAEESSTLGDVRNFISAEESVEADNLRIFAAGSPLDNDALPVPALTVQTLDCNVALLGGNILILFIGIYFLLLHLQ